MFSVMKTMRYTCLMETCSTRALRLHCMKVTGCVLAPNASDNTLESSLSRRIGQRKESSYSCWDSNASSADCVCVCVCSLSLLQSNCHGSSFSSQKNILKRSFCLTYSFTVGSDAYRMEWWVKNECGRKWVNKGIYPNKYWCVVKLSERRGLALKKKRCPWGRVLFKFCYAQNLIHTYIHSYLINYLLHGAESLRN